MSLSLQDNPRRFPVLVVLAGLVIACARPAPAADWQVKPDPPAEPVKLEVRPDLVIPVPSGDSAIFPTTPSPFVALGQNKDTADSREVWDLRKGTKFGTIKGKIKTGAKEIFRLSPDGKYLAVRVGESSAVPAIEVWSFATGQKVERIDLRPGAKELNIFDFAGPGQLAVVNLAEADNKQVQFYEIETGNLVRKVATPKGFVENTLAFSPGRKYFAYTAEKRLRVHSVETGKPVGELPLGNMLGAALAFSPDGTELAGLFFEGSGGRLLVWDVVKGETTVDHHVGGAPTFSVAGRFLGGAKVDWLPDGSAWLLADHAIVDRQDGRWVWSLLPPEKSILGLTLKVVDNDHAVGVLKGPSGGPRLAVVTLPWPQIDASLKAMRSDAPALLKPGQGVSLKFYMGSVRHTTPQEAQAELAKSLTEALGSQGIKVSDGQSVVLHVRHSEAEAGAITMRKIGEPRGSSSGPTLHGAQFSDEFALTTPGTENKPIWTEKFKESYAPFGLVRGEINDKKIRDGAFHQYNRQKLVSLIIPYFIPKDNKLATLPGSTIPTVSATARPGLATPKATTRGQSSGRQ